MRLVRAVAHARKACVLETRLTADEVVALFFASLPLHGETAVEGAWAPAPVPARLREASDERSLVAAARIRRGVISTPLLVCAVGPTYSHQRREVHIGGVRQAGHGWLGELTVTRQVIRIVRGLRRADPTAGYAWIAADEAPFAL